MTGRTRKSASTILNPSGLPDRYEIRQLTEKELPWIAAIVIHSNMFHSTVFPIAYPNERAKRCYAAFKAADYLLLHQIKSGHSYGIFDNEYQYKIAEAQKAGGKLLWNPEDESATGAQLLEQMDFPLVSVAMAYDGYNALDMEQMLPLIATLPCFAPVYHTLETLDPRDPKTWQATGPNQLLLRNATSTRHDYEGLGLMRKLANWLMRYADQEGFRGIQIECLADAVIHVWSHPPEPFGGGVVSEFQTESYEEEEVEGEGGEKAGAEKRMWNPFNGARQRCAKVYVDLKPEEHRGGVNGVNGVAR